MGLNSPCKPLQELLLRNANATTGSEMLFRAVWLAYGVQ